MVYLDGDAPSKNGAEQHQPGDCLVAAGDV
jgi:hypothetical protein